jgi:hypothetical protein
MLTPFRESLAKSRYPRVAVIMSEVYAYGASVLETFRERGGITIAPEPTSAYASGGTCEYLAI